MPPVCSSLRRCGHCPTCAWRFSRRPLREHLTRSESAFLLQIDAGVETADDLHRFRAAMRNLIDHQRRRDRRWLEFATTVWVGQDAALQGIARLGSLGPMEVSSVLTRRWPTMLQALREDELRETIYRCVLGSATLGDGARFQKARMTIRARHGRRADHFLSVGIEPMPMAC